MNGIGIKRTLTIHSREAAKLLVAALAERGLIGEREDCSVRYVENRNGDQFFEILIDGEEGQIEPTDKEPSKSSAPNAN